MRADMSKVITERPRHGHTNPSRKTSARLHRDRYDDDDHGRTRIPSSRFHGHEFGGKAFSDLLGPLRRFLRRQVGRPWSVVFSEMCAHLDRRTLSGRHVWTHVWSYVQRDCWIDERG